MAMSMKNFKSLRLGAVLASIVGLAACSNDPTQQNPALSLLRQYTDGLRQDAPAPPNPQLIAQAVAETQGPLELILIEKNQAWALMLLLEQNRGYDTFGSAFRQTATMRNGILTATRGFGNDLMSVDISQVEPLITGRTPGQGVRVMRHIGDEDKTTETRLSCTISVGGRVPVQSGAVNVTAQQVTETCQGEGQTITNTYLVDGKGRSVGSKQWVSPLNGYFLTQTLRQ